MSPDKNYLSTSHNLPLRKSQSFPPSLLRLLESIAARSYCLPEKVFTERQPTTVPFSFLPLFLFPSIEREIAQSLRRRGEDALRLIRSQLVIAAVSRVSPPLSLLISFFSGESLPFPLEFFFSPLRSSPSLGEKVFRKVKIPAYCGFRRRRRMIFYFVTLILFFASCPFKIRKLLNRGRPLPRVTRMPVNRNPLFPATPPPQSALLLLPSAKTSVHINHARIPSAPRESAFRPVISSLVLPLLLPCIFHGDMGKISQTRRFFIPPQTVQDLFR